MMVAIDLGPQQIERTAWLSDQLSWHLIHRYQPSCPIHTRVWTMSIHKCLRERNLHSYQPLCYLPLAPAYFRVRFQWCLAQPGCNDAAWGCVVFIEDSRFQLRPDDNRKCVRRRPSQCADPPFNIVRHTDPQQGIMIRGAISLDNRTPLVVNRGALTSNDDKPWEIAYNFHLRGRN